MPCHAGVSPLQAEPAQPLTLSKPIDIHAAMVAAGSCLNVAAPSSILQGWDAGLCRTSHTDFSTPFQHNCSSSQQADRSSPVHQDTFLSSGSQLSRSLGSSQHLYSSQKTLDTIAEQPESDASASYPLLMVLGRSDSLHACFTCCPTPPLPLLPLHPKLNWVFPDAVITPHPPRQSRASTWPTSPKSLAMLIAMASVEEAEDADEAPQPPLSCSPDEADQLQPMQPMQPPQPPQSCSPDALDQLQAWGVFPAYHLTPPSSQGSQKGHTSLAQVARAAHAAKGSQARAPNQPTPYKAGHTIRWAPVFHLWVYS